MSVETITLGCRLNFAESETIAREAPEEEDWIVEETKHTTDADGKYRFTIPPEQSSRKYMYIELDVEAPGYAPQKRFGYSRLCASSYA